MATNDDGVSGGLPSGLLTFVFTDIEASTRLYKVLGDQIAGDVFDLHNIHLRAAWDAFGGHEVHTEGDSFFVVFEDPNQAYTESLTEGEREAYQTALNGEFPDAGEDFSTFEPGGCQGAAFENVYAFGQVFDQFGDQFEEIEQAYDADSRIVAATSGWSSCMSEAGHSFTDQDGAEEEIRRRYNAIVNSPDAFADGDGIAEQDAGIQVEDGGEEEFIFGPQSLNPEAQVQVDELAVEERIIALASWECNAPLREIEDEVRIEYEQRFVDENGEAIRAALGE